MGNDILRRLILVLALAAPLAFASGDELDEPAGQVHGFYSHGSMANANVLPAHGPGFVHLFESRDRHYGSAGLLELVSQSADTIGERFPEGERLQIGDIAGRHGGYISGHASHQNGLDIDIVYYRVNHHEQTGDDGDHGFIESFVKDGKATRNLDLRRNWEIMKLFHASGRLNRIFVHTAIKEAFCRYVRSIGEYEDQTEVLRHLRPQDNHFDHMHVRLTCPDNSPACQKQSEVPPGSGCSR